MLTKIFLVAFLIFSVHVKASDSPCAELLDKPDQYYIVQWVSAKKANLSEEKQSSLVILSSGIEGFPESNSCYLSVAYEYKVKWIELFIVERTILSSSSLNNSLDADPYSIDLANLDQLIQVSEMEVRSALSKELDESLSEPIRYRLVSYSPQGAYIAASVQSAKSYRNKIKKAFMNLTNGEVSSHYYPTMIP